MRARLKSEPCDVWQNSATGDHRPTWVFNCTEVRSDGLYLIRASGKQRIEPGDWLIRDLDADTQWLSDRDFRREYEIVNLT